MNTNLTYLSVLTVDGGSFMCVAQEVEALEECRRTSFENREHTILALELIWGGEMKYRFRDISGWSISTPESRAHHRAYQKELEQEDAQWHKDNTPPAWLE